MIARMKRQLPKLHPREQLMYINIPANAVDAIFCVRPGSTILWWLADLMPIHPQNTWLEFSMSEVYYLKREMRHLALAPWHASVGGLLTKPIDESEVGIRTELLQAALIQMWLDGTTDAAMNFARRNSMLDDVVNEYETELRRRGIESETISLHS